MDSNNFFGNISTKDTKQDSRDGKYDPKSKYNEEELADALYWFILDDDDLHKRHFMPLAHSIQGAMNKKEFDHGEHVKKWMPMVNAGCMKFYKMNEMYEDPKDVFPFEMRKGLCHRIATQHHQDIESGEYNLGDHGELVKKEVNESMSPASQEELQLYADELRRISGTVRDLNKMYVKARQDRNSEVLKIIKQRIAAMSRKKLELIGRMKERDTSGLFTENTNKSTVELSEDIEIKITKLINKLEKRK